jgi:hypothetical protein
MYKIATMFAATLFAAGTAFAQDDGALGKKENFLNRRRVRPLIRSLWPDL